MKSQLTLSKYLRSSLENPIKANINESFVLSAIVCTACIGYAAGPMLNNDFFKSVGAGIGNLLSGIGSIFGNFNIGGGLYNRDTIKELLKKDADDLTGREKDILKKASNNKRLQKDLSNNELKALNKAIGKSSDDNTELDDDITKELHTLLKKKPEDLTPREKKRLSDINDNYDLSDELSDAELKRFEKATGSTINYTGNETETENDTKSDITPALLMLAKKSNESETDEAKKSKNNALIDIITASIYDENGELIPLEKRADKMKSIIGEDWENFKTKMEKTIKDAENSDDFKDALKNAKDNITEKDVASFTDAAKENAKNTHERLAKEKAEREDLNKQIEEIKSKIENTENEDESKKLKEDLEKLENDKKELNKKSLIGQTIEEDDPKSKEEDDPKSKEEDDPKSKEEDDPKSKEEGDPKSKEEDDPKLKEYTDEEIEKIQTELTELDPEKDKDAIKEKEALLKSIAKTNGKNEDEYIPKEAEVTDPETGKKVKRIVHTGPRGGRFYYPDGKPKTPEHKVYVENKYNNLRNYLTEQLNYKLTYTDIVNESLAITTTLAAASATVTNKKLALLFIRKIVKTAKKYIKIAFRIFNDLNMKDKIQELNNSGDVLQFIKDVVTDDNAGLDDPKDIAIVTAIILAIWYITKWNKQKTKEYIQSVDNQLYTELKPELSY